MNLELIIQSEIIQKDKDKYRILTCIYGIQKDGTDEPVCRAAMETQTQQTALRTGIQGRKERGMDGESSMETCIPDVNQIADGNLLYDSGNSNRGSVTTQRRRKRWEVGGRFKRVETYVYLWLIHFDPQEKPMQYFKATIP